MSVDTMNSLRITRLIQANQQAVWDAWTQPDQMRQWSCPEPGGVQDIASDFRVGGSYTIAMRVDGKDHTAIGTYQEIDAPNRLVYTWNGRRRTTTWVRRSLRWSSKLAVMRRRGMSRAGARASPTSRRSSPNGYLRLP